MNTKMNVDVCKMKETFAELIYSEIVSDLYKIQTCGNIKTKKELFDLDVLYLKIKSIEACQ